jgi:serine/threonine protein kinase
LLPTLKQLFNREVAALKKLGNYPQVPQLLAHFEENQEFYLVQEFIAGSPLSDELKPGQQWSESQVIDLLQEVLGILSLIHSYGLIHRDVKPNNLIRRQKDRRLVLIDFGSVKQAWMQVVTVQGKTSASYAIGIPATLAIGTSGYMPTEQGRGRPRPNSDIYALGIIGIQALTGLSPTELLEDFNTAEVIWQHKAQVSADLASVLNKMVCYDFKDRYQSATEVLQALQPLINTAVPQHSAMTQLSEIEIQPKSSADTVVVRDRVRQHLPKNISNAAVLRSFKKPTVLIGIATSAGVLALILGNYYFARLPASISQAEQNSVVPPPNTASGNIALTKTLRGHSNVVWSVAINPDGQTLASGSEDKTIKLWNLPTGELQRTLKGHGTVWSVAFSLDGQILASGSNDNTIKWNLPTGVQLTISGHTGTIWSVALNPDGQTLASSSEDKTIKLWNLATGELQRTLEGHTDDVRAIAFSLDGQTLASGSSDNTIKLWNLPSGSLVRTLLGHQDRVIAIAFSRDKQILASGSVDKTIKIWHPSSGKLLRTLARNPDWVNSIAISPDSRILASGIGDVIKVWDLNTGYLLQILSGHSSDITSVSFSANGKTLVSASRDRTIKVWQL